MSTRLAPAFSDVAQDLSWHDLGECQYVDPELFFPEKGGSTATPKRVCAGCHVRAMCLEWALENAEQFGVWGGMSAEERGKITRARGITPPGAPKPGYCRSGRHERTEAGTGPDGRCPGCKREADQRARRRRTARQAMIREAA